MTRATATLLAGAANAVLLMVAGCASSGPAGPTGAPVAAIAPAWQAVLPSAPDVADLSTWWARFGDPLLPPLIDAAQTASPTLASAAARIERARANRVAAGAVLLPQVNMAGSASQGRSLPRQPTVTSAGGELQAAWEIDLFGANLAGRRAAQARLEGAQAQWHDARVSVAAEVGSTYLALRACEAQRVTAQQDADSRAETARLTVMSRDAGFTAPADAALARAGAAQARVTANAQRAQCDLLFKSLVELTALDEPGLRQRLASGTARLPQPAALSPPPLPARLLAQRPDLFDAARAVVAAAADSDQARARQLPQVSIAGSLGAFSVRTAGETLSGGTWSIGPLVVNFPLFDGGVRAANSAAARAGYDEAVALYQAQVRRAVREVEASLVGLQSTAERFDDARLAAADFEASLRATEARQRGGLASLFDLENARRNAVAAQSALIELQRERAANWITLYRALGGGWNESTLAAADPSDTAPMAATP